MGWHTLVGAAFTGASRDIANYKRLETVGLKSSFIDLFAHCAKVTTASPIMEIVTTNAAGTVLSATQFTLTGTSRQTAADNASGDFVTIRYTFDLATLRANSATAEIGNQVLIGVTSMDSASSVKVYALSYGAEGGRS